MALQSPIAVCPECGTVHHRNCWDRHSGCSSYGCAPSHRRADSANSAERLIITTGDLDAVIPARPLASSSAARFAPAAGRSNESPRRRDPLAIASLITAIAGIPLFGILTGFVAIILACLALGRIQATRTRGVGLAVSGLLLGVFDMVGWAAFLSYALSGTAGIHLPDGSEPEISTADVSPKLYRAMRANVLIDRRDGWIGMASGSGVILEINDGSALIVTNRHIVDSGFPGRSAPPDLAKLNTGKLTVKLLNGAARPARVTWVAPDGVDLALVRVTAMPGEAEAASWAPGRPMRIGDQVFAIGNPQRLSWTHTQGVISQFRTMNQNGRTIRLIQTQTAINPGNSGGGLYDDESNLIGITTFTSDKRTSEGLSFAIAFDSLLALDPPGIVARKAPDPQSQKGLTPP